MCNTRHLASEEEKLSLRYMDELFQIEDKIGEVAGIISLQDVAEPDSYENTNMEVFEAPVKEEPKQKKQNEEGEEEEEEAAPEE